MRVKVTATDIESGFRDSCEECPIAIAMRRMTRRYVNVNFGEITVGKRKPVRRALPPKAKDFVTDFDKGYPVKPFEFSVRNF